ncbi:MAG: ATP-binding protein [Brumimicrobium sp.]
MINEKIHTAIGTVKSVNGSKVSVKLSDDYKSSMPIIKGTVYRIGQIGSFVRIPLGYANLYGIVTQAGAEAIPEKIREELKYGEVTADRWITVVLVGERVRNQFERGVIQYPAPDDEVHLVTIDDLQIIYSEIVPDSSITVGHVSVSESLPAHIELNKFISRHSAIVGSTGSGKSNAVSIVLEAIASNKNYKSSRILLIDPHGEYNETLKSYSKVFKINPDEEEYDLQIPFWALPFDELIKVFPGNLKDSALDEIRLDVQKRKLDASEHLSKKPDIHAISSDSPIPFSLKKLWYDLDDFEKQVFDRVQNEQGQLEFQLVELIEKGDPKALKPNKYPLPAAGGGAPFLNKSALGIRSYLNGIRNKLIDDRYSFLFQTKDYTPDLDGKLGDKDLNDLLASWLNHSKPITILDLSGIPPEIMIPISGSVTKIIYDSLFWGQELVVGGRKQPLLVVLEEAHNYLKAGEDSIASRTIQSIAKEGRKYGVGLLLVSQRPSELDETVLSQLGTMISLRMANSKDRSHIGSAIQDDLNDLVSLLPSLRTGEGIIMGESVKIPSRIKFDKIAYAPKGSDPKASERWKLNKPDSKEYEELLLRWRNRKFNLKKEDNGN